MPNEEGFQSSDRQVQTAIPSAIEMSIREVDWLRLFRCVRSIPKPTSTYQIGASFSFGIVASGLAGLIPIYTSSNPHVLLTWGVPGVVVAATIIGFLLNHFAKRHEAFVQSNCEAVIKDMKDIYNTFFPLKDLEDEAQ